MEIIDPDQQVHGPIDRSAVLRRPPIDSLLHSGTAEAYPLTPAYRDLLKRVAAQSEAIDVIIAGEGEQ